jgi:hypothetical protein
MTQRSRPVPTTNISAPDPPAPGARVLGLVRAESRRLRSARPGAAPADFARDAAAAALELADVILSIWGRNSAACVAALEVAALAGLAAETNGMSEGTEPQPEGAAECSC